MSQASQAGQRAAQALSEMGRRLGGRTPAGEPGQPGAAEPGSGAARTGEVEANLARLNEAFKLPHVDELIAQKVGGPEKGTIQGADLAFHEQEYQRLTAELETARDSSQLAEEPSSRDALNDLLVRLRTKEL